VMGFLFLGFILVNIPVGKSEFEGGGGPCPLNLYSF